MPAPAAAMIAKAITLPHLHPNIYRAALMTGGALLVLHGLGVLPRDRIVRPAEDRAAGTRLRAGG